MLAFLVQSMGADFSVKKTEYSSGVRADRVLERGKAADFTRCYQTGNTFVLGVSKGPCGASKQHLVFLTIAPDLASGHA